MQALFRKKVRKKPLSVRNLVDIGKRLAEVRAERKLTQAEMADLLGVDRSYLAQIEIGRTSISVGRLFEIAKMLEMDRDWLVYGDKETPPAEVLLRRSIDCSDEMNQELDTLLANADVTCQHITNLERGIAEVKVASEKLVSMAIRRTWELAQKESFRGTVMQQSAELGVSEAEIVELLVSRAISNKDQ